MRNASSIQTFGSLLVAGSFVAAEAAAQLLAISPGNALLWRLNTGVFSPFEFVRVRSPLTEHLFGPASLAVGCVILAAIIAAHLFRVRLLVACFANMAFAAAATLAVTMVAGFKSSLSVSLVPSGYINNPDTYLVYVLAAASLAGFCVSHWTFIQNVRSEWRSQSAARPSGPSSSS